MFCRRCAGCVLSQTPAGAGTNSVTFATVFTVCYKLMKAQKKTQRILSHLPLRAGAREAKSGGAFLYSATGREIWHSRGL